MNQRHFFRRARIREGDRTYLRLAMPAAFEGLFMVALSAADIIMVGALGVTAIAAVSIFTQPRMVLLIFARSIASALTLLVAHRFGAGRDGEAAAFLRQTLAISLLLFVLLHLAFYWKLDFILSWMGAEAYLPLAMTYGRLALVGVFLASLSSVLQAYLLGRGETRDVMLSNVWGNIVNVIGNALFIYGIGPFPALGVLGAAVGTVMGTAWTLGHTLYVLRGRQLFWCGAPVQALAGYRPSGGYFRAFLPVLGSIFSEQGFERVGMVLYTRMVAELGTAAYAIHAICMNFCDFYYQFAGGLGKASMVVSGHARGAGDGKAWKEGLFSGLRYAFFFSCLVFLLTAALREPIFLLYADDAALLPLGSVILLFVAAASFPEAHQLVSAGSLRGAGRTAAVALCSFVSVALLRPLFTAFFLYGMDLGLVGAWCALFLDQSLRAAMTSVLLLRFWRSGRRQQEMRLTS